MSGVPQGLPETFISKFDHHAVHGIREKCQFFKKVLPPGRKVRKSCLEGNKSIIHQGELCPLSDHGIDLFQAHDPCHSVAGILVKAPVLAADMGIDVHKVVGADDDLTPGGTVKGACVSG